MKHVRQEKKKILAKEFIANVHSSFLWRPAFVLMSSLYRGHIEAVDPANTEKDSG